jgi:membrane protease YdiL (CAAX protease family)
MKPFHAIAYNNRLWVLALPFFLYGLLGVIFTIMAQWFGKEIGYLLGFACYWIIFGGVVPVIWTGKNKFTSLLKDHCPLFSRQNWMAAGLWVIVSGVTLIMYGGFFLAGPFPLILVAILTATLNGICEEIFWRGIFVQSFPDNPWLGIVYPAIGFAFWHFIPQSVFPAPNVVGFVFSTVFLGLAYGFIAYRTGSAKWTAISHSLNGILALGGMVAPMLLKWIS